jgi:hypothetical protein
MVHTDEETQPLTLVGIRTIRQAPLVGGEGITSRFELHCWFVLPEVSTEEAGTWNHLVGGRSFELILMGGLW